MNLISMPEIVKILIWTTVIFIVLAIVTTVIKTLGSIYNAFTIKRYRYVIECQIMAVDASKKLIKTLLLDFNRSYSDSVIEETFSSVKGTIRQSYNKYVDSSTASVLYGVLNERDRNNLVEALVAECWDEIKNERCNILAGRPIYMYPADAANTNNKVEL